MIDQVGLLGPRAHGGECPGFPCYLMYPDFLLKKPATWKCQWEKTKIPQPKLALSSQKTRKWKDQQNRKLAENNYTSQAPQKNSKSEYGDKISIPLFLLTPLRSGGVRQCALSREN